MTNQFPFYFVHLFWLFIFICSSKVLYRIPKHSQMLVMLFDNFLLHCSILTNYTLFTSQTFTYVFLSLKIFFISIHQRGYTSSLSLIQYLIRSVGHNIGFNWLCRSGNVRRDAKFLAYLFLLCSGYFTSTWLRIGMQISSSSFGFDIFHALSYKAAFVHYHVGEDP